MKELSPEIEPRDFTNAICTYRFVARTIASLEIPDGLREELILKRRVELDTDLFKLLDLWSPTLKEVSRWH